MKSLEKIQYLKKGKKTAFIQSVVNCSDMLKTGTVSKTFYYSQTQRLGKSLYNFFLKVLGLPRFSIRGLESLGFIM